MNIEHPPDCGWHRDWHSCACGLFDTIHWVEPGPDGKAYERYCSGEEAAQQMFVIAARNNYEYGSAKEAIDDFIALHWAWIR